MVAIAVALIATFYLYKEMQKSKLEIQRLSEVPPSPAPAPPTLPPVPKPIIKKEKVSVVADEIE